VDEKFKASSDQRADVCSSSIQVTRCVGRPVPPSAAIIVDNAGTELY
jgi:hypothetical protein